VGHGKIGTQTKSDQCKEAQDHCLVQRRATPIPEKINHDPLRIMAVPMRGSKCGVRKTMRMTVLGNQQYMFLKGFHKRR
jgi:hypothetical protein